jgi:phosphoglycolate phosphatase
MPPFRLAIFDFDGTLADTFPWFIRSVNGVADKFGFKRIDESEVEALRGRSASYVITHLAVPPWKIPAIAQHVRQKAREEADQIPVFPGVDRVLAGLDAAGVRIAVVSSNSEPNVRHILGAANAARVAHYACGAALFGKASKLRGVAKRAGVTADQAIAIGDEIRDADAARAAGLAFGAVSWGFTTRAALEAQGPRLVFDDMDDMLAKLTGRA